MRTSSTPGGSGSPHARFHRRAVRQNCLAFHENTRLCATASFAQVTERLYDRSRYRYRHYRKHLEPAAAILEPEQSIVSLSP